MIKRILILVSSLALSFLCPAKDLSMSSDGRIVYEPTDIDARVNYPVRDFNDRLCALVKVTVVGELKHALTLDLGTTMQFIERRDRQEIGEVWFYIPAGARRMTFKCSGYEPIEIMDVPAFQPGGVYRITIETEFEGKYVTTAVVKSNYLKVKVPEGTFFSIGRTKNYEISSQILQSGDFTMRLDFGEYYYRAENGFYETSEGVITVDGSNDVKTIDMTPAYSYLDIETEPSGASVFIDGEIVGTSPVRLSDRIKKGTVSIRAQKDMYYPKDIKFDISGDMQRHTATLILSPQFGTVTCRCEDPDAELWIDNRMVGIGTWTGVLSSLSSHFLEVRKKGHLSQSINFEVSEGDSITKVIGAPEPLYGSIEITSIPSGATVRLDGKTVGVTPFILNNVLAVEHQIALSKDGYESNFKTFGIEHNKHQTLSFVLEENIDNGNLNGHEWIDLGLNVKWATCNIGADKTSDYGDYFAWGETSTKSSYIGKIVPNKISMIDISGNSQYDIATSEWGDGWRMPTKAEFEELLDKCKWEWVNERGYCGYKVFGPNGKNIFLPLAGVFYEDSLRYANVNGVYSSSTPVENDFYNNYCLMIGSDFYSLEMSSRHFGLSVRPVIEKEQVYASENTHNGYECVDLGLSVMWATHNVGAATDLDKGDYFAWGEIFTKSSYTQDNSRTFGQNDISGNAIYDVATSKWGKGWRMPTIADFADLRNKCKWEWMSQDGHKGYKIIGPNGNSIFLPAGGSMNDTSNNDVGDEGFYWSSACDEQFSMALRFWNDFIMVTGYLSGYGYLVRPVCDKH